MTGFLRDRRARKGWIVALSVILSLAVLVAAGAIYVNDYYRADEAGIQAFYAMSEVTVEATADGIAILGPMDATKGLIFYPGGKVEYTAYQPLMSALSREGVLCILVEMPFNLAVLDMNAADGIREQYPQIKDWYMGGHSLGGSMAASYLEKNAEDYKGLILLGSYSTADLSQTDLDVLSVYGSEDQVMNRKKYEANKSNLPHDFTEIVIDGGCHAYFGMYGAQDGDGKPSVTNQEQIQATARVVLEMMSPSGEG